MTNLPLFDSPAPPKYPQIAGAKGDAETSRDAAEKIERNQRAPSLRAKCLELLTAEALTADECAAKLSENPLSIRPRLSQLKAEGLIEDTGKRRASSMGEPSVVWAAK